MTHAMHHHDHSHGVSPDADRRRLAIALALIVGFMCVEVVVGIAAHSLALLSDAAHMLSDAGALALSLVAIALARRPARGAMTYGLGRSEILAAAINGSTLLVLGLFIVYEGIRRLIDPPDVEGAAVLLVARAARSHRCCTTSSGSSTPRSRSSTRGPSCWTSKSGPDPSQAAAPPRRYPTQRCRRPRPAPVRASSPSRSKARARGARPICCA